MSGDVQLARGGVDTATPGPEFVDVVVKATGAVQSVPAHWVGDPVLGVGITPVDDDTAPQAAPAQPQGPSDVQLVAGTGGDLPHIPAVRAAVAAQVPEEKPKGRRKTHTKGATEASDETPAAGDEE